MILIPCLGINYPLYLEFMNCAYRLYTVIHFEYDTAKRIKKSGQILLTFWSYQIKCALQIAHLSFCLSRLLNLWSNIIATGRPFPPIRSPKFSITLRVHTEN